MSGPPDISGMTSLKVDNLTYRTTSEDVRDMVRLVRDFLRACLQGFVKFVSNLCAWYLFCGCTLVLGRCSA